MSQCLFVCLFVCVVFRGPYSCQNRGKGVEVEMDDEAISSLYQNRADTMKGHAGA